MLEVSNVFRENYVKYIRQNKCRTFYTLHPEQISGLYPFSDTFQRNITNESLLTGYGR